MLSGILVCCLMRGKILVLSGVLVWCFMRGKVSFSLSVVSLDNEVVDFSHLLNHAFGLLDGLLYEV